MPIKNDPAAVRTQIRHALRNDILSSREAKRLLTSIKQDGVTAEEVQVVVDTLKAAMAGGDDSISLDVSTSGRQRNLNRFLGTLNEAHPLPLGGVNPGTPAGSVNWMELMTQQSEATTAPLAKKSFGGQEVGVDGKGQITLGNTRLDLEGAPTADLNEALWALNQSGQLEGLDEKSRTALQGQLLSMAENHSEVANDAPGKYKKLVAANAAAGALALGAESWDSATTDKALALAEKAPNPMMKSLLLRGLEKAELTPEQKTKFDAIEQPEHKGVLLESYDNMRSGAGKIGYTKVEGPAAGLALSALAFAKSPTSIENIEAGMKEWKDLNSDYSKPWDGEEIGHMNRILEAYVDKYPQTAYTYGTFSKNAPKEIANVTNARVVEALTPELDGSPPSLKGLPLTREQADYVKTLLPNIRDDKAADKLVRSLVSADAVFKSSMPSSWGTPTLPDAPLSQASFELFKKSAGSYQETAEASTDGKLDYSDFSSNIRDEAQSIQTLLKPRMAELNATPPTWRGAALSTEAAGFIREQLTEHTRSSMSVENLDRAIDIFAKEHGSLEGAGFDTFKGMVTEYKANWPDLKTFDFNKLERIASFKVQGKEVPLCTIDGQKVGLAEFYGKVGMEVLGAIDKSTQKQPWVGDRWGYRAKESVEILDVVAEQTLRGEGPVAKLRDMYPGKEIEIQATGRDGAHEQFLYAVKDGYRTVGTFAQGSDGEIGRFNGRTEPILFTSTIGEEGELNVEVPDKIRTTRYPLQTNYGVGDKIDIHFVDNDATEGVTEGETFSTKQKILEAEILGFDARGNYEVKFTNPKGEEVTKTLPLKDIRKANNPHYFKPKSSYFSDVTINLQTDPELKSFLEEAQPIIDRFLPADGSTVTMSPQELAKRQKDCIKALMEFTDERVKYPASKDGHPDEMSAKYHELDAQYGRFPLGELVKIGKGVCRHQCILEHLLLQQAGIESRLASGSANTSSGNFRGYHIWAEVTLADNERYLSDQTWTDAVVPLWEGAYGTDKRRKEMYHRTARYDNQIELPR